MEGKGDKVSSEEIGEIFIILSDSVRKMNERQRMIFFSIIKQGLLAGESTDSGELPDLEEVGKALSAIDIDITSLRACTPHYTFSYGNQPTPSPAPQKK